MAENQKEIYDDLERTFNTPGWSHLKQGWKEERDALPLIAFFNVKTMEELETFRVRHTLLSQLIGLPEDMRAEREALEQEERELNV